MLYWKLVLGKICGSALKVVFVPRAVAAADAADVGQRHAPLVFLLIDVALAADLDLAPLGEEVDHGDADAVQTAGGLIGPFLNFPPNFSTVITPWSVEKPRSGCSSTGMPRPLSSTVTEPSLLIITEISVAKPAIASSIELSTTS